MSRFCQGWSLQVSEDKPLTETMSGTPLLGRREVSCGAATHHTDSRGSSTPASKASGKNMHSAVDELPSERAELFRKAAATALYIPIERPSVQFAVHEILSGMSTHAVMYLATPHRLARHMLQYPDERWDYEYQRTLEMLEVPTDTSWAADTETSLCHARSNDWRSTC